MSASTAVFKPTQTLSSISGRELLEQIEQSLEAGSKVILVDLAEVLFMDSTGLGYLVSALKRVRAKSGQLYLCSLRGQAAMLFDLTNMHHAFQVFSSREDFDRFLAGPTV